MKTVPPNSTAIVNSVREFIASTLSTSVEKVTLEKSLFHDLGVDGDDALDLINGFSVKFNVSLKGFDFQKYFGNEAASGPVAFFVELFKKESSGKLLRLEVADLVRAASNGSFFDDASN
jgi:acyl carrier protein